MIRPRPRARSSDGPPGQRRSAALLGLATTSSLCVFAACALSCPASCSEPDCRRPNRAPRWWLRPRSAFQERTFAPATARPTPPPAWRKGGTGVGGGGGTGSCGSRSCGFERDG